MKKLFKLALLIGGAALVAKIVAAKKAEWHGMTETEVRDKLDAKLGEKVPDEKRAIIADKVVSTMRHKSVLTEEPDTADTEDAGTE